MRWRPRTCARAPGNGASNNGSQGTGNPNGGNNGNGASNGNAGGHGGGKGTETPGPSAPSAPEPSSPGGPQSSEADTRGDASRRQFCMRHPSDFWCLPGAPFIAPPKR